MAKLYFRFSAMNAGKSTALLQVAHNYEEQGQKVALFTAAVDDRFGEGKVTSRLGVSRSAKVYNNETSFLSLAFADIACILVDEAQFLLPSQVKELHRLAHLKGVPVICYGLRSDFQGNAFPGSSALLTLADDLEEVKTICACGRKASMNMRITSNGQRITQGAQVEIGGNDRYRSVCPRCFYSA